MAGWTNKGKYQALLSLLSDVENFRVALVTAATAPGPDTNTLSDLTEIPSGNGYTAGGRAITYSGGDFGTVTEDDTNDRGSVTIDDVTWTATGGSLPASGDGARYAVLTDASGNVFAYFDLTSDRTLANGESLTLSGAELRLNES